MQRSSSAAKFSDTKSPSSNRQKMISAILDNPSTLICSAHKNLKDVKVDPSFVNNLQSQLTQVATCNLHLNYRFNLLEHSNQTLEERTIRMQEAVKYTRKIDEQKDKELVNLQAHNNYLLNEKRELEGKLNSEKKYILKLERKLLEWAKKKGIISFQDISLNQSIRSKGETLGHHEFSPNMQLPIDKIKTEMFEVDNHHNHLRNLEDTINNQAYEIQILRTALENKSNDKQLIEVNKGSLMKETAEIRIKFAELEKETKNLSQENQILSIDNEVLKDKLRELGSQVTHRDQISSQLELKSQNLKDEIEISQKKLEIAQTKRNSLYEHIAELNEKLRVLEEENRSYVTEIANLRNKSQSQEDYSAYENESKETLIKSLRDQLKSERNQAVVLNEKFKEEVLKKEAAKQDEMAFTRIEQINNQLIKESNTLKNLIEEQDEELQYYKQLNSDLIKEKEQLRKALETFVEQNTGLEDSHLSKDNNYVFKNGFNASGIQYHNIDTHNISGNVEKVEFEKRKLRLALNAAINKCAALRVQQKDYESDLQKKQGQIYKLSNSKSKVEETLANQLFSIKNKNEKLQDGYISSQKTLKTMKSENEQLRSIVRKYERKPLEQNSNLSTRYYQPNT